ncbi:hypothetical protein VP01_784g7 [Puccinia sorghi]|uniref:Bicarbonate transporter-like transmembrane domain-containing protein n=1 Tax=Puccinia sorghi TaxID=27349 RepID=A0A0L6UB14_9BASI|nr:hypothetical protein VP01_784g7 [Puccinia sorghi]
MQTRFGKNPKFGTAGSPESESRQLGWKICETNMTLTGHSHRKRFGHFSLVSPVDHLHSQEQLTYYLPTSIAGTRRTMDPTTSPATTGVSPPPSSQRTSTDGKPWSQRTWSYHFKNDKLSQVFSATLRMYFINLMPAIAYLIDMYDRTDGTYGINEGADWFELIAKHLSSFISPTAVLASALAALVFSLFSAQPLTIVGVTGLINLFNYTDFDIVRGHGINYLQFQAWMLIWAAIFHFIMAVFNFCDFTRFITDMTSETFGFYVGVIYIQKGIELLTREFSHSATDGWLSVVVAITFALTVYWIEKIRHRDFQDRFWAVMGKKNHRRLCVCHRNSLLYWIRAHTRIFEIGKSDETADYAVLEANSQPRLGRRLLEFRSEMGVYRDAIWFLTNVAFRKFICHIRTTIAGVDCYFNTRVSFTQYFDHNVSSLMAQARHFPVEKPAGFHWDFFLLGITTLVSGILGLPAPNGLVPQAPVHTESLSLLQHVSSDVPDRDGVVHPDVVKQDHERRRRIRDGGEAGGLVGIPLLPPCKIVRTEVAEQRLSHLGIGLLTLGTMTRPLLVVLGTMPRALFAGIFIGVGWSSIEDNGIIGKTLYLIRDPEMTPPSHPLNSLRKVTIMKFIGIQWVTFAIMVAISQTIAAIGFPLVIIALIPFRYYYGPRWFSPAELSLLDSPTANAPGVMVSIGGDLSRVTGEGLEVAPDTGFLGYRVFNDKLHPAAVQSDADQDRRKAD